MKLSQACGASVGKSTALNTPAEVSNTAMVSPAAGWVNCTSADSTAGREMAFGPEVPLSLSLSEQPVSATQPRSASTASAFL